MSNDFVGMLREITEEGDLNSILKSSIGGYTKKSVSEYFGLIKKQQQNLKTAYAEEMEHLQAEIEGLRRETQELRDRSTEAESGFQERLQEKEQQMQQEYAALENDMDEALHRIAEDEEKLLQYEKDLKAEQQRTEQTAQEANTLRIQLDSADAKIRKQEQELADRDRAILELKNIVKSLQDAMAEDTTAEWEEKIQTLSGSVELLQKEIKLRDQELENSTKRLEMMTRQEQSNHAALDELQTQLQKKSEQNEWAESENEELGRRLKEQMEQIIVLSRENAHLKSANAILQRKLGTQQIQSRAAELVGEKEA